MIPILYEADETSFTSNGLGRLSSALSCTVTEERNGGYELAMSYPVDGIHFSEIAHSRIIYAVPADGKDPQPFRIYRVSKPMRGKIEVFAEHTSYQLTQCILKPFDAVGINQVLAGLSANTVVTHPFTITSEGNLSTSAEFVLAAPASIRSVMGGQDGSMIDTFGGEWEWNRFDCILHEARGRDRGVSIRYGKNLLDMTQEENIQNVYTGIVPYWRGQNEAGEEDYVFLEEGYIEKAGVSADYPYKRLQLVDLTQEFDGRPNNQELLDEANAYIDSHDIGKPVVNLTVSFVALWQTEEYKNIAPLERVNLCDTVSVEFEKLGVSATAQVVKTVYNVLLERYDSIELGEPKGTLAKTVQQSIDSVKKSIDDAKATFTTSAMVQQALDEETAKITGGLGGYVVLKSNADGQTEEILIMDSPDIETAVNVIRMNKNGIGFSQDGYNPEKFVSAWTIDGKFNGQFIATGTLVANQITAGMLRSANGNCYFDLDNDEIVCSSLIGKQSSDEGDLIISTVGVYDENSKSYYKCAAIYRKGAPGNAILLNPRKTSSGSAAIPNAISSAGNQLRIESKNTHDVYTQYHAITLDGNGIHTEGRFLPNSIDGSGTLNRIVMNGELWITGSIYCNGYKVNPV